MTLAIRAGRLANARAHGRVRQRGEMNSNERQYAAHLEARKLVGEILWFEFEPFKFRLADNTYITADWGVLLADHTLEIHETKGAKRKTRKSGERYDSFYATEDAMVKLKVAAERFPFVFKVAYRTHDGNWMEREV